MKICLGCIMERGEAETYCWLCGEKLKKIENLVCSCGRNLHPPDQYCPTCGKKVEYV